MRTSQAAGLRASDFAVGCVLDLGGVGVDVRAPDAAGAIAISRLLQGAELHEGEAAITLRWQDAALPLPERPSDTPFPDLDLWHVSEGVALRYGPLTALASGRELLLGGPRNDSPETLSLEFRRVFEPGITYLLSGFDRFMLHGAAIARGGDAIFVVGSTGRGKSTLAWAALQAGWELLSDDYVFVRPARGGYEACGLRKPISVPGEVLTNPPPEARRVERGGRERWELPASILAGGWRRVAAVLRPAHGEHDDARLTPMPSHEALTELVGAFLASGDHALLRRWFPHAAALSRLPAWELWHARPREARLAAAARGLEGVLRDA
jgi:hypothetical protein